MNHSKTFYLSYGIPSGSSVAHQNKRKIVNVHIFSAAITFSLHWMESNFSVAAEWSNVPGRFQARMRNVFLKAFKFNGIWSEPVFLLIMSKTEFYSVNNRKENRHYDNGPFNLKVIRNLQQTAVSSWEKPVNDKFTYTVNIFQMVTG